MVLKGKRALITGGSRGIGKAIAAAFLKEGASVMIAARSRDELAATKSEFEKHYPEIHVAVLDVSDPRAAKTLVHDAAKIMGGIDILVNAAGIYGPIGFSADVDLNEWKKTFEVNLFGTFYMFREVIPLMMKEKKGKIINFSGGGDGSLANFSAYSASKASVVRLTETLAEEVKKYNIDVNAIAPGPVNTKLLDEALVAGESSVGKEKYAAFLKQKQEGGVLPEKAAELCVFLASSASDGLTGKLLSAVWDHYKQWDKKNIEEITKSNLYNVRRVNP